MAKVRKIAKAPTTRNYFIVDACVLANKYIPPAIVTKPTERERVQRCVEWWAEIDAQVQKRKAIVYVPDICIAEAFKVLAKKYYEDKYFQSSAHLKSARDKLIRDLHMSAKSLKAAKCHVRLHDISTSRDIIIMVDRYYEIYFKARLKVSVPDLIILATAKYLLDFFGVPRESLHIVTMDNSLWKGTRNLTELPVAHNPASRFGRAELVFE